MSRAQQIIDNTENAGKKYGEFIKDTFTNISGVRPSKFGYNSDFKADPNATGLENLVKGAYYEDIKPIAGVVSAVSVATPGIIASIPFEIGNYIGQKLGQSYISLHSEKDELHKTIMKEHIQQYLPGYDSQHDKEPNSDQVQIGS